MDGRDGQGYGSGGIMIQGVGYGAPAPFVRRMTRVGSEAGYAPAREGPDDAKQPDKPLPSQPSRKIDMVSSAMPIPTPMAYPARPASLARAPFAGAKGALLFGALAADGGADG